MFALPITFKVLSTSVFPQTGKSMHFYFSDKFSLKGCSQTASAWKNGSLFICLLNHLRPGNAWLLPQLGRALPCALVLRCPLSGLLFHESRRKQWFPLAWTSQCSQPVSEMCTQHFLRPMWYIKRLCSLLKAAICYKVLTHLFWEQRGEEI